MMSIQVRTPGSLNFAVLAITYILQLFNSGWVIGADDTTHAVVVRPGIQAVFRIIHRCNGIT